MEGYADGDGCAVEANMLVCKEIIIIWSWESWGTGQADGVEKLLDST